MLSRFLALVAVLMLACASTDAHAYASPLQPENARQGFAAVDKNRTQEIAELSAERVKENSASAYDCTSRQTLGEQFDPNLGFYNLRARWMDPKSARFLNSDDFGGRAGDPPSLHKYLYANADPVNRMDPGGHESLISVSMAINIVGIGSTVIHAGFKLAEGDYEGAAWEVGRDTAAWFLGAGVGKLIPTLTKPLVGLINRAIHNFDNSLLLYGLPHSSQILTYNMERLAAKIGFGGKPAGWQAHHIVGEAFPEGRAAVDLLTKKFHIDINSPLNGVYLPGCGYQGSAGVVGLAVHCGLHTQEYARLILRELSQAKDEMDAINVLNRIREELTEGALTLNRRGNL